MSVTIRDIAKVAGVSPSTVSRALTNHPRISAVTKERIQQLAQEMGYTPSFLARGLVTRRTATIGVVISTVSDPFLTPLVRGIEDLAYGDGYSVFFSNFYHDAERELEAVRAFYERRVSGLKTPRGTKGQYSHSTVGSGNGLKGRIAHGNAGRKCDGSSTQR